MTLPHAIISGGSSGIGLALGVHLAARGFNLSLLARDPERLTAARRVLETHATRSGQAVACHSVDVADEMAVALEVGKAIAAFGPPDLVVAGAGIVEPGYFGQLRPESFRRQMDVNYFGVVHLVRAALPAMQARRSGRLVLLSSAAALLGFCGYTAYAPTKFAVRGFAEALRSECAPDGVGVSVVYPPDTDTPQLREEQALRPEATRRIAAGSATVSADFVARSILRGIDRGRFVIAPGLSVSALARFHSLVGPALHRFWFDPIVTRYRDAGRTIRSEA